MPGYYYYLKCTNLNDTVTLNVAGALYTVKGIMENTIFTEKRSLAFSALALPAMGQVWHVLRRDHTVLSAGHPHIYTQVK